MRDCGFNVPLDQLTPNDRREIRNFRRFIALWPTHGFEMVQRPRWQKYLALTPEEAAGMTNQPPWTPPKPSNREMP